MDEFVNLIRHMSKFVNQIRIENGSFGNSTWYIETDWQHVYTDCSYMKERFNSSTGVYSTVFSFYKPIGKYLSNYELEIQAIYLAVDRVVIFVIPNQQSICCFVFIQSNRISDIQKYNFTLQSMNKYLGHNYGLQNPRRTAVEKFRMIKKFRIKANL